MLTTNASDDRTLVALALDWFRHRLPESWSLREAAGEEPGDFLSKKLVLQGSGGYMAQILVQPRSSLSPRDASALLRGFGRDLRSVNPGTALLVVAPWLSPRTREILAEEAINYIDLTGNALVRLENPAVYLETAGATRNPQPRAKERARLQGPKAARLIRLLADVAPPYGVRELAASAQLALGYTSQILEALYDEALIERSPRGRVESVDVRALLKRWATTYDVLRNNAIEGFIAPTGLDDLLGRLASGSGAGSEIAITGSFSAVRMAPIAAPVRLLAYCEAPPSLAETLRLLPADEGADVILMQPFDPVVWQRTLVSDGLRYAAPSQVAVDCLTGPGRMPSEGEALLDWMEANESSWRAGSLQALD